MMIQGYYRTGNLNACMKRLQNQYRILCPDHDYSADTDDAGTLSSYKSLHPDSLGDRYSTNIEQCAETGDYLFNLQLTQEQVDTMPKNDNPNFTFQYGGELDDQGEPLPLPTFKRKTPAPEGGTWDGTFYPVTICQQGGVS